MSFVYRLILLVCLPLAGNAASVNVLCGHFYNNPKGFAASFALNMNQDNPREVTLYTYHSHSKWENKRTIAKVLEYKETPDERISFSFNNKPRMTTALTFMKRDYQSTGSRPFYIESMFEADYAFGSGEALCQVVREIPGTSPETLYAWSAEIRSMYGLPPRQ